MRNYYQSLIVSTLLICFGACKQIKTSDEGSELPKTEEAFNLVTSDVFQKRFDKSEQDSILLSIVTYTYKAPKGISGRERFKNNHRDYYNEQLPYFTMVDYHITEVNRHYFLLLRPARNVNNYKRTVGGTYLLSNDNTIKNYFEIFNTPMLPDREAIEKGKEVLSYYIKHENLGDYFLNKNFVEFPDERCVYDTTTYEWYYPKALDKL